MGKGRRLALIAAGLVAAGVWIAAAGKKAVPTEQLDLAANELDLAIREASASAHARAVTLAELPRLGWAVATDAATVRDLTTEELAFRPRRGEQLEIAQVQRRGGAIQRLISIPNGIRPLLLAPDPGLNLEVTGEQVRVTAVVKVEPRQRVDAVSGLLAVAQEVDLTAASTRLDAANIAGRLETAAGSTMLGTAQPPRGARAVEVRLQSPAARAARLVLSVPSGIAWGQVGGALALLATAVIAALALKRPKAEESAAALHAAPPVRLTPSIPVQAAPIVRLVPPPADPDAPEFTEEVTAEVTAVDSAVQAVGGGVLKLRPLEVSGPIITKEAALTTVQSSLFLLSSGPAPAPAPEDDPQVTEYRALFREFVKLRRTCGESTGDLSRDHFVEALRHKRGELLRKGAKDVRFRLVFDNGKAAVRFKAS